MMADYEKIKMAELVSVEETDNGLVLEFQGGGRVVISVQGEGLHAEVS